MISVTYIQYVLPTGGHLKQVSGRNLLYSLDLRFNALIVLLIGYRVGKRGVRWERQEHRQEVVHSSSITLYGGRKEIKCSLAPSLVWKSWRRRLYSCRFLPTTTGDKRKDANEL